MSGKKKILIIDDDASFVESAEAVLKTKDFEVIKAFNAESGIEALAVENPGIVLLDVNLPDKNGFDVLKMIRTSQSFSELPVILITGDIAVHVDKGFSEGADDVVFKPIDLEKLSKNVSRLLK
ncbi:MAG: response regulator [Endomicrobia bacterium]|nr:response regulator [Endomicrobiia bacterium]